MSAVSSSARAKNLAQPLGVATTDGGPDSAELETLAVEDFNWREGWEYQLETRGP